jgi:hypothetical protein
MYTLENRKMPQLGYKETVKQANPKCFLTFDGDLYDPDHQAETPEQIFDDSGFDNHGEIVTEEIPPDTGYSLGYRSLVELEQSMQKSLGFCINGAGCGTAPLSWLEIPDTPSFHFQKAFTIEFFFEKHYECITTSTSFLIIDKRPFMEIYLNYPKNADPSIVFKIKSIRESGLSTALSFSADVANLFGDSEDRKIHHVVATASFYQSDTTGVFWYNINLWVNGKRYPKSVELPLPNYTFTSPEPFRVGYSAYSGHSQHNNLFAIDQLAIYDYELPDNVIIEHYRKTKPYKSLVLADTPAYYWPLDDKRGDGASIKAKLGGIDGQFKGEPAWCKREIAGPDIITDRLSQSVSLNYGGTMYFVRDGYEKFFNYNNYTLEFWFNLNNTTANEGVIFSHQDLKYPFDGILVTNSAGYIHVRISTSVTLTCGHEISWRDNEWHYFVLTHKQTHPDVPIAGTTTFYLDGVIKDSAETGITATNAAIMTMGNSQLWKFSKIKVAHLAIYDYCLPMECIKSRSYAGIIYCVSGYVSLESVPYRAEVRIYDFDTGEYEGSTESTPRDGSFRFYMYTQKPVKAVFLNKEDRKVLLRVVGPLLPVACS